MAANATQSKIDATRGYGAEVILHGEIWDDAYEKSLEIQKQQGQFYVHPFDNPLLIAGQGGVGLEIIEDLPEVDIVVVPIGGGGLISGTSMGIKLRNPNVRIIGVESSGAPAMKRSIDEGRCIRLDQVECIIDGLVVKQVGENTLNIVREFVDDIVLVSDEEIFDTVIWLMDRCKVVPEGAAAASVAALRYGRLDIPEGATVACVLSGGNLDLKQLRGLKWN
jgi:threonine dehydratase